MNIKTVSSKPTPDHDKGTYKVIKDGIYWGHYYVGQNWAGDKFVAEADPRDGLPW